MQEVITFECTKCRSRNYSSMKNKKKNPDKLQRSKFCAMCRKHTPHKEIK